MKGILLKLSRNGILKLDRVAWPLIDLPDTEMWFSAFANPLDCSINNKKLKEDAFLSQCWYGSFDKADFSIKVDCGIVTAINVTGELTKEKCSGTLWKQVDFPSVPGKLPNSEVEVLKQLGQQLSTDFDNSFSALRNYFLLKEFRRLIEIPVATPFRIDPPGIYKKELTAEEVNQRGITVPSKEWDEITKYRADLIHKMYSDGGLTEDEYGEFQSVQQLYCQVRDFTQDRH